MITKADFDAVQTLIEQYLDDAPVDPDFPPDTYACSYRLTSEGITLYWQECKSGCRCGCTPDSYTDKSHDVSFDLLMEDREQRFERWQKKREKHEAAERAEAEQKRRAFADQRETEKRAEEARERQKLTELKAKYERNMNA